MPKKAADTTTGATEPGNGSKKLRKLLKDARVAMLTTVSRDGRLRSRPMLTSEAGPDGVWFITRASSLVADEIRDNQRVNVSYADRKGERYVSVAGTARLVNDAARLRDLWTGKHKGWFPLGKKDPDLTLLQIVVDQAEHWDGDEGRMVPVANGAGPGRERRMPVVMPEDSPGAGAQG